MQQPQPRYQVMQYSPFPVAYQQPPQQPTQPEIVRQTSNSTNLHYRQRHIIDIVDPATKKKINPQPSAPPSHTLATTQPPEAPKPPTTLPLPPKEVHS